MTFLRGFWEWVRMVRVDDPLRAYLGRTFATLLLGWMVATLTAMVIATLFGQFEWIYLPCIVILALAWWLNRRGSALGIHLCVWAIVLVTPVIIRLDQVITTPGVGMNFIFFIPVLISSLFISPRYSVVVAVGIILISSGYVLSVSDIPPLLLAGMMAVFVLNLLVGVIPLYLVARFWHWLIIRDRAYTLGLEQMVAERSAQLEESTRQYRHALDDLCHDIGHTIRDLLRVLERLAPSLARDPASATDIAVAQRSLSYLMGLIDDLTYAVAMQTGTLRTQPQALALDTLVQAIAQHYQADFAARNCQLTILCPSDVPPVVADPHHLERVLRNVLTNALKFTTCVRADGSGHVQVSCALDAATGQYVRIQISDNGCGIEPDQLAQLGQRKVRLHAGAVEGMGLGLSLSQSLLAQNGGSLTITSAGPQSGTTVTLYLPITLKAAEATRLSAGIAGGRAGGGAPDAGFGDWRYPAGGSAARCEPGK